MREKMGARLAVAALAALALVWVACGQQETPAAKMEQAAEAAQTQKLPRHAPQALQISA